MSQAERCISKLSSIDNSALAADKKNCQAKHHMHIFLKCRTTSPSSYCNQCIIFSSSDTTSHPDNPVNYKKETLRPPLKKQPPPNYVLAFNFSSDQQVNSVLYCPFSFRAIQNQNWRTDHLLYCIFSSLPPLLRVALSSNLNKIK